MPVGHTHEDIDGCFGTLAQWFTKHIIQTPQAYKTEVKAAFQSNESLLKCDDVIDVLAVPNYQAFFGPHIDSYFGRTHKLKWTQHQYRFEAVTIDDQFPHGAKFSYRKFCSDQVVVIEKKPVLLCRTRVGRLTGLLL